MYFKSKELKEFRKNNGLLIDVRSPGEYYKGNMPNSINIPLFDNEERSSVGKKYKNNGNYKALLLGLSIIENKLDNLIEELVNKILIYKEANKTEQINIYCSRGGMRSKSIAWLINKLGFEAVILEGGYKSYRRWVLKTFESKIKLIVIGGKTGTGKTRVLNLLNKSSFQVIDLEFLANHRGSTFGALGMKGQPTNEEFENLIAEQLHTFNRNENIYVEAESANIGKCRVPYDFFKQMQKAERIEIIRSLNNRIEELVNTYSRYPQNDLKEAVLRIKKRLGPQRTKLALDSIDKKQWENVCKAVLEYYDKCYEFELEKIDDKRKIDLTDKKDLEVIKLIVR